jgi:hypothetical protein
MTNYARAKVVCCKSLLKLKSYILGYRQPALCSAQ